MVNGKKGRRTLPKTVSCVLNAKKQLIIPHHALSNTELYRYVSCLKIPFFRGVFMRDELPLKIWKNESGIINLDNSNGPGTHWVCYQNSRLYLQIFYNIGYVIKNLEIQSTILIVLVIYHHQERSKNIFTLQSMYFTIMIGNNPIIHQYADIYVWNF
jgi:hypothetical protein